jgi:CheY-like chemotaxis protein
MTKNRNLTALIVEDDEVQQVIVQNLLNAQGIATKIVDNGLEAWNVLKNKEFNFIMMDVKMPDHDGLEVVQWIREETDSYFKEIPIFALTSFSSSGYTQQVLKAGMNAHLTKPLEINILMEHLEKYFPSK